MFAPIVNMVNARLHVKHESCCDFHDHVTLRHFQYGGLSFWERTAL